MRRIGLEGVVVAATIASCKPPLVVKYPGACRPPGEVVPQGGSQPATASAPATTCTEADASPATLRAVAPAGATVTEVELFMRARDPDAAWATVRMTAGAEADQARFAEQPAEVPDGAQTKQICQGFTS